MARGEEEQKPKKNKDKNKKDKKDKKVQGLFAGCWHPLAFAAHILSIPRIERIIPLVSRSICLPNKWKSYLPTLDVCMFTMFYRYVHMLWTTFQGRCLALELGVMHQDKKEDQGEGCQIAWRSTRFGKEATNMNCRQGHEQAWEE